MSKEVKRIAEAAKARKPEWYALDGHDWFLPSETMEFMSSVTPEYVLALLAERDVLKKDAERYRWLRLQASRTHSEIGEVPSQYRDQFIDAALQGEQP